MYIDITSMLIMGGVELNPGPTSTHHLNIAHINITKLDETISPSLYKLDGYHTPFTRHRNRNGGGVALYSHASLPIKRLKELEFEDEEWIWAKVKLKNFTLLICCVYLPPNLNSNRLQAFIDRFIESVSLAHTHSPTAIMVLGDFNTGNVYLDTAIHNHSGITFFDHKLNNAAQMLNLTELITEPTDPYQQQHK